ncbi:MAG: hypothetical protein SVK08_06845 [Halobacteriota archaeon]|nr:hypothetical protein [Halobacteriota archaeon]
METSKAVVKSVLPNGSWDSKYGTMYKFEVHFENGDYGEYNSKSQDQNKMVVGQEVEYTRTSREYNGNIYYTIKPVQQQSFGGGYKGKDPKTEGRIVRMNVLQRAVDLCIAGKVGLADIKATAEGLEKWVLGEEVAKPQQPPQEANDLPF